MKIIYNNLIPLPGFVAMMLFGVIFARRKYRIKKGSDPLGFWDDLVCGRGLPGYIKNHEGIHKCQAEEFRKEEEKTMRRAYMRYYGAYLRQWVKYGYKNAPLEREAKTYAMWPEYISNRKIKAWEEFNT